jgi:pimeloyl-ACP methyl ester carboxylesterase
MSRVTSRSFRPQTIGKYADAYAASNEACVAQDRELLASMTSATAAHDLDAVRAALGLDRVDYFGASWGTELGAAYSSLHGNHVGRMLLDSVVTLGGDATKTLDELAEAYAAHPLPAEPGETPNADADPSEGATGEESADGDG